VLLGGSDEIELVAQVKGELDGVRTSLRDLFAIFRERAVVRSDLIRS